MGETLLYKGAPMFRERTSPQVCWHNCVGLLVFVRASTPLGLFALYWLCIACCVRHPSKFVRLILFFGILQRMGTKV